VSDASGTQTLEVRKNKDDYYARSSVTKGVYKINSDVGKELEKTPEDYRNKKVYDFGFSDPTKIDITGSAGDKSFVRSGTDWKLNGQPWTRVRCKPLSIGSGMPQLRNLWTPASQHRSLRQL
jgi:hypothetical protein